MIGSHPLVKPELMAKETQWLAPRWWWHEPNNFVAWSMPGRCRILLVIVSFIDKVWVYYFLAVWLEDSEGYIHPLLCVYLLSMWPKKDFLTSTRVWRVYEKAHGRCLNKYLWGVLPRTYFPVLFLILWFHILKK